MIRVVGHKRAAEVYDYVDHQYLLDVPDYYDEKKNNNTSNNNESGEQDILLLQSSPSI